MRSSSKDMNILANRVSAQKGAVTQHEELQPVEDKNEKKQPLK